MTFFSLVATIFFLLHFSISNIYGFVITLLIQFRIDGVISKRYFTFKCLYFLIVFRDIFVFFVVVWRDFQFLFVVNLYKNAHDVRFSLFLSLSFDVDNKNLNSEIKSKRREKKETRILFFYFRSCFVKYKKIYIWLIIFLFIFHTEKKYEIDYFFC